VRISFSTCRLGRAVRMPERVGVRHVATGARKVARTACGAIGAVPKASAVCKHASTAAAAVRTRILKPIREAETRCKNLLYLCLDFCRAKAMPSVAALVRAAQKAARVPAFFPVRLPTLPEAAAWASSGHLTPAAVAAAVKTAMTVKRSPEPHFMYTEVGVPDRLPDATTGVGARTDFVDMDPGDFVRACELQDGKTVSQLVKVGRSMIRAQRVPVLPLGPEKYVCMYKVLYGPRNMVAST